MKAKALYLETDKMTKIVNKKVKNGTIKIKDKSFDVDKTKPLLIEKRGFPNIFGKSIQALYILKHDQAKPLEINFRKGRVETVSPENYSKMMKQETLNTLLSLKGTNDKTMFLWLIIGSVIGFMAGIIMSGAV